MHGLTRLYQTVTGITMKSTNLMAHPQTYEPTLIIEQIRYENELIKTKMSPYW